MFAPFLKRKQKQDQGPPWQRQVQQTMPSWSLKYGHIFTSSSAFECSRDRRLLIIIMIIERNALCLSPGGVHSIGAPPFAGERVSAKDICQNVVGTSSLLVSQSLKWTWLILLRHGQHV